MAVEPLSLAIEMAGAVALSLLAGWASAWGAGVYGAGPRLRALVIAIAPLVAVSAVAQAPLERAAWGWVLGWTLMTLAAIDLAVLRLPDVLTLPLAALGLAEAWATQGDLAQRAWGMAAGVAAFGVLALLYARLRGRSGLGAGDVKLLGAAGAWVGAAALPQLVLWACVLAAGGIGLRALIQGAASMRRPVPLGAALAAATWAIWLSQKGVGFWPKNCF